MRGILGDHPLSTVLPFFYKIQSGNSVLSRAYRDPIPVNDTTYQVKKSILVKTSVRNWFRVNSKRAL